VLPSLIAPRCGYATPPAVERLSKTAFLRKNNLNYMPEGNSVNKTELIDEIAKAADISKASASRALEAMIDAVAHTLKNGDTVTLAGFGTFAVTARAERIGRNPRTREEIKIPASKVPKFKPGKALKDALN
jgi:DNA-binding protein HU-beta